MYSHFHDDLIGRVYFSPLILPSFQDNIEDNRPYYIRALTKTLLRRAICTDYNRLK